MDNHNKPVIFVMGVSGSGKSTIGKLLAKKLAAPFFDGDDYHPKVNIKKMAQGHPLNDDDRHGWLIRLNKLAKENVDSGAVIACSALKEAYRTLLGAEMGNHMEWVYLEGSFEEISNRLRKRKNHFMPAALLQSQFDTLEPPKKAITVSITKTPEEAISEIVKRLKHKNI
ncbi:MAG: gluconokinase [Saonia sp.]